MIGRAIKRINHIIADFHRRSFLKKFDPIWLNGVSVGTGVNVISFSGKRYFADQLLSISSFYRNVGVPNSWIIYDDGTYGSEERHVFEQIKGVEIRLISNDKFHLPLIYYDEYPTLKKIEVLFDIENYHIPVLFADSDILFYKNFKLFKNSIEMGNWFLVDEGRGYFDSDYMIQSGAEPLNFGFLVLNEYVSWLEVFDYLLSRITQSKLQYWSDQTAVHILAQKQKFKPLPKEFFLVGGNDSFTISHCCDYQRIALRHFVGPVRHKMWQYPWKKLLAL